MEKINMYGKEEKNSVGTFQMFCDSMYPMNELNMILWSYWHNVGNSKEPHLDIW